VLTGSNNSPSITIKAEEEEDLRIL